MMCPLEDGDVVEVFVRHLVDEAIVWPMLIENGSHVDLGESGSTFNTRPSESENFNFGVDVVGDDDIDVGPVGPDFSEEEVEVGDDDEEEYVSDVHEEVRELRAEKRSFQRRKRRERVSADNEEVTISHEGRLGGDEPYFASSDEDSFEIDEDECCDDDEHESGRSRRLSTSVIKISRVIYFII
ncbi:hypothetical protein KY285_016357 [Solanum tuberosum]|nr:hypothetical protein KY285_016357 [Solanum tuberosum]